LLPPKYELNLKYSILTLRKLDRPKRRCPNTRLYGVTYQTTWI